MDIRIEQLMEAKDLSALLQSFLHHNRHRDEALLETWLQENQQESRITLIARIGDSVAGCGHVLFQPDYFYFRQHGIPEMNDLIVFEEYQRQGIANRLMDELEALTARTHAVIGIGVGLYKDYGAAQRIYCRRSYLPDGNGLIYRNAIAEPGSMVEVDDDLLLFFTKQLK